MVTAETILIGVALFLLLPAGFVVGRLLDIDWRCIQMRRFLKRNFIVLNIVEDDGRVYLSRIVDAMNAAVMVDNYLWIITKGRVYRKDKPSMGSSIKKKDIHWGNQGAPNVFVSKDDLTPIPLTKADASNVKPDELGSVVNAWVDNEIAKRLATGKTNWMQIAVLAITIINLLLAFGAYDSASKANDCVNNGVCKNTAPAQAAGAGAVTNGTVVINQNPKGGVG